MSNDDDRRTFGKWGVPHADPPRSLRYYLAIAGVIVALILVAAVFVAIFMVDAAYD